MPTTPLAIAINMVGVASAVLTIAVGARGFVMLARGYDFALCGPFIVHSTRGGKLADGVRSKSKVWMFNARRPST